jgi:hypothetical protein
MRKMQKKQALPTDERSFLQSIRLFGPRLVAAESRIDHRRYFGLLEDRKHSAIELNASYRLLEIDDEAFDAEGEFRLVATDKTGAEGLSLRCVYQVHFHVTRAAIDRKFAATFVQSELRIVLWPYFRYFVSDTCARMGIPPVTVPLATERGSDEDIKPRRRS